MAFIRVYPEKFQSLWYANYFDKRSFTLPSNRSLTFTPVTNQPDNLFFDKGVSYLAVNSSTLGNDLPSKAAIFQENPDFIKEHVSGDTSRPISTYSQADCQALVTGRISNRQNIRIVTTGASEVNAGNYQWNQTYVNNYYNGTLMPAVQNQYHWIDQTWSSILESRGGRYHGDYDGHGNSGHSVYSGETTDIQAGYNSTQGAYNFVMSKGSPNPFFIGDAYTYRHGLVKTYATGYQDMRRRLFVAMTDLLFTRKALNYKGSTKRNMSFAFAVKNEFVNHPGKYKRTLPNGGDVLRVGFPQYAHKFQTILGYISMALADDLWMWEDTIRHGSDPQYTFMSDWAPSNEFLANGVAETYRKRQVGRYTTNPVPYPDMPYSGVNAMLTGVEFYARACQWAGQNVTFAPFRTLNGTYSNNDSMYLFNSYMNKLPTAFVHSDGNKRAIFAFDAGNEAAGTYREWEFNVGGGSVVINMEAGKPYFYLGEV